MDAVVIDTDVLSYLFKQDSRGESYQSHLEGKFGVLSFMLWPSLKSGPIYKTGGHTDELS